MMMTITFPIRSDVRKLRPVAGVGKTADQTICESFAVVQQSFKGHTLRDWPVVEKSTDRLFRRQVNEISAARVDAVAADILPASPALASHTFRLARRHDGVQNPIFRQYFQRFRVGRGLRQPHTLRAAFEAMLKIRDTPLNLGN